MGRWNSLECSSPCHGEDHGFKSRTARYGRDALIEIKTGFEGYFKTQIALRFENHGSEGARSLRSSA